MNAAASTSVSRNSKPSATSRTPSATTGLPFLAPPPLIPGESVRDYEQLLAAVSNTMRPVDLMETIWTRDIVDLQWDIIRFRRIKADLITRRYKGSTDDLSTIGGPVEGVKKILAGTLHADIAGVVAVNISVLARIDRMVMTMEARRNAAYREAERHRFGMGERLRRAAEEAEDGLTRLAGQSVQHDDRPQNFR